MINEVIEKGSEDIVTFGTADIEELLRIARKSKLNRARYVMHRTNQDAVQEMIIALTHQVYIKPHKHLNKMESFFIIEGNLSIVFFDDAGVKIDVVELDASKNLKPVYYRMNKPMWHTVVVHSDFAVILETTTGPFKKSETEFAEWAPEEFENDKISNFIESLGLN